MLVKLTSLAIWPYGTLACSIYYCHSAGMSKVQETRLTAEYVSMSVSMSVNVCTLIIHINCCMIECVCEYVCDPVLTYSPYWLLSDKVRIGQGGQVMIPTVAWKPATSSTEPLSSSNISFSLRDMSSSSSFISTLILCWSKQKIKEATKQTDIFGLAWITPLGR